MLSWQKVYQKMASISEVGAALNWEIVLCRECLRAVCMSSERGVKSIVGCSQIFPFAPGRLIYPFPFPHPQSPILLQLSLILRVSGFSSKLFLDYSEMSDLLM